MTAIASFYLYFLTYCLKERTWSSWAHAFNSSTGKAETRGTLWVLGQPRLHRGLHDSQGYIVKPCSQNERGGGGRGERETEKDRDRDKEQQLRLFINTFPWVFLISFLFPSDNFWFSYFLSTCLRPSIKLFTWDNVSLFNVVPAGFPLRLSRLLNLLRCVLPS